jgi:deoxyadenosine/deoxycytidine kinase
MVRYVVLDGNIGAGKTTALSGLRARGIVAVTEPVDEWCSDFSHRGETHPSPISLYYNDPSRNSMSFQLHVLTTCVNKFVRAFASLGPDQVAVVERDPFDLALFVEDNVRQNRFSALDHKVFSDLVSSMRGLVRAEHVANVYLRLSPEKCMERIRQRSRDAESAIDVEYVRGLHELHDEKYSSLTVPHIVVDASEAPSSVCDKIAEFVSGI